MICKKNLIKTVKCCIGSCYLYQYFRTISIFFHHAFDSTYLAFNTVQPMNQVLIFLFRPLLGFMVAATLFFFHKHSCLSLLFSPPFHWEYTYYIPHQGILSSGLPAHFFLIRLLTHFSQHYRSCSLWTATFFNTTFTRILTDTIFMMCSFLQTLLSCVMIVYNDNNPDFVKIFLAKKMQKDSGRTSYCKGGTLWI